MKDVILIDKPAGWTSFDVVAKVRGKIRAKYTARGERPTKKQIRVGHAGTLDPFATGLLIILLGDACKDASSYLKLDKTYEFIAKLGKVSSTGDPEGKITPFRSESLDLRSQNEPSTVGRHPEPLEGSSAIPSKEDVGQVLSQFTGKITQTPPAYSAIKIGGKRAYKLAREGKSFEIPSRKVTIGRLQLVSYEYPYLKCICDVSSGTYIRSLVEDIGKTLKTGAYCTELRRTRIGEHQIEDAQHIDNKA